MTPLWDRPDPAGGPTAAPSLPDHADVVVVGAGITGMAAAVELARAGLGVVVLEDRHVGAGATGLSTAKVTVLHGLRYSRLRDQHGADVARRYAEAQRAGLAWFEREAGAALEPATAFTYAADQAGVADVRAEVEAARAAGIDAAFVGELDVPFPALAAAAVDAQAEVDPLALLDVLRGRLVEAGGRIVEGCRASSIGDGRRGVTVRTSLGDVRAAWVVVATGLPFVDRGLLFARTEPQTSYCIGVRTTGPLPDGMYLSAGEPVRSVRTAADPERPGRRVLVVGGAGHKTGALTSTRPRYQQLVDWTAAHFSIADVPWRWSTEDFVPADGLPFVGELWPLPTRTLVATGYAKWGFTNAAAAASVIAARIAGTQPPAWAADWTPRRLDLRRGGRAMAKANADVVGKLVGGWLGRIPRGDLLHPTATVPAGEGGGGGVRPQPVSAVCTHLGGIVRWNDGDGCWDCPLHGSKFAADGTLLHGPATRDLPTRRR